MQMHGVGEAGTYLTAGCVLRSSVVRHENTSREPAPSMTLTSVSDFELRVLALLNFSELQWASVGFSGDNGGAVSMASLMHEKILEALVSARYFAAALLVSVCNCESQKPSIGFCETKL